MSCPLNVFGLLESSGNFRLDLCRLSVLQTPPRDDDISRIDALACVAAVTLRITMGSLAERTVTEQCSSKCLCVLGSVSFFLLLAFGLDACHQAPLSSDLSCLVAEIRVLRGQLEQSIQVNNCLRLQLELQLEGGVGKASPGACSMSQSFTTSTDPGNKQPIFQGRTKEQLGGPHQVGTLFVCTIQRGQSWLYGAPLRSGWNRRWQHLRENMGFRLDLVLSLPNPDWLLWVWCLNSQVFKL